MKNMIQAYYEPFKIARTTSNGRFDYIILKKLSLTGATIGSHKIWSTGSKCSV